MSARQAASIFGLDAEGDRKLWEWLNAPRAEVSAVPECGAFVCQMTNKSEPPHSLDEADRP